jgi:hypothetical protein
LGFAPPRLCLGNADTFCRGEATRVAPQRGLRSSEGLPKQRDLHCFSAKRMDADGFASAKRTLSRQSSKWATLVSIVFVSFFFFETQYLNKKKNKKKKVYKIRCNEFNVELKFSKNLKFFIILL